MSAAFHTDQIVALQRRAITGALMAGQSGSRESIAFWRGQFNALQSLLNSTGAALATKDARSAYVTASELQGAWRALANHPDGLSGRRVLEVLTAFGLECANHDIAKSEVELTRVFHDRAEAAVVDTDHKHAARAVDGNDGSGVHATPLINQQMGIVAQGETA